jgi:pimeloyl-ACP methyl ester carboxylesterase
MASYVLVPGAGGAAWYWSRVLPLLEAAGAEAVAVDLPGDDPLAGLDDYVDRVVAAADSRSDVVLVGQSLGAFSASWAAARVPAAGLILVNGMIPVPGETPGEWWDATGQPAARRSNEEREGRDPDAPFDLMTAFLHDVPPEVAAEGEPYQREEADAVFESPWAVEAWPDVPTRVIAGADDRFFPLEFQQRIAAERLGIDVEVVPGGHLCALSCPDELSAALLATSRTLT